MPMTNPGNVLTVKLDDSRLKFVEPEEQTNHSALATSTGTYNGKRLSWVYGECDVL